MSEKEEIGYEEPPKKISPKLMDMEIQHLKNESVKKLEKAQMDKQVRADAGITEIPKEPESIPKELPKLVFKLGSKVIKCDKMLLDDDDAKVLAKHLSILVGGISSKWYSAAIIIIIVISKVCDCWDGLSRIFKRKKADESEQAPQDLKEQGRPEHV